VAVPVVEVAEEGEGPPLLLGLPELAVEERVDVETGEAERVEVEEGPALDALPAGEPPVMFIGTTAAVSLSEF